MIDFQHFVLDNGLNVYVHEDHNTNMAAFNLCYNVGSRDENPDRTGFAHLFEHLMFGGSKHVPAYDTPLQQIGAQNNAFTSPDITNYYINLPAQNIETAFWLESDRMMALNFDPKVLDVQKKVVVEEYKQRYLNQPYGDVWLKIRPLAYQKHSYRWATIGKEISHIEEATMTDVQDFFYSHYLPNNANLVVAGNVTANHVMALAKKWFEPIPAGKVKARNIPPEPVQTKARFEQVKAQVPFDSLYKAYHMPARHHKDYLAVDLYSDILGRGKSSILYEKLVKQNPIFNSISAYVTGSLDPGLFLISGQLSKGIDIKEAEGLVNEVVAQSFDQISENQIEKVKNQAETTLAFAEIELLNRAMALAFAANAGDVNLANKEAAKIQQVSQDDILVKSKEILQASNCSTLYYLAGDN